MSFISYAQNFEDVMLWRAFKHVENGFYIDIGAQDPIIDSVSLGFYEHGWRGVHVEPTRQYSGKLRTARPDEIVEQLAIGDSAQDSLVFYEFADTGLSTADPEVAKRHEQAGYKSIQTAVPVISLDALLEKHGNQDIHWLKLDVEGLETSVLQSWRHSVVRPWVLVIESTRPMTQDQSYATWEPLVIEKDYSFVYFDGLNRFYLHKAHSELLSAFSSPPNIFDGFVLSGTASQPFFRLVAEKGQQASERAAHAEAQASHANERAANAETQAQQASDRVAHAEAQASERAALAESAIVAVHRSLSWRLTKPLRILGHMAKQIAQWPPAAKPAHNVKIKQVLGYAILYVSGRPKLRHAALRVLAWFPGLKARLEGAAMGRYDTPASSTIPTDLQDLTPRARQIYDDLKTAMERRQKAPG